MRLNPNVTAAVVVITVVLAAALALHHVSHRAHRASAASPTAADTLAPVSGTISPADRGDAAR